MSKQREQRRVRVETAISSAELEGGHLSPEFLQDARDYINGNINSHQLVARTQKRYGVTES